MMFRQFRFMNTMSCHASAYSADAASSCAHFKSMHATASTIAMILDALFVASIFIIGLVILRSVLVLLVLVLLAGLLILYPVNALKTRRSAKLF